MELWPQLMTKAKKAFVAHSYEESIELNLAALTLADSLLSHSFSSSPDEAIGRIMVCYLNICDAYTALKQLDKTTNTFKQIHQFLCNINLLAEDKENQQAAILRASNSLLLEWNTFQSQHAESVSTDEDFIKLYKSLSYTSTWQNTESTLNIPL